MIFRRTKIIATLGPATDNNEILKTMIDKGMNCARLNCSHGNQEELIARANQVRSINPDIPLLFDLQGAKIRLDENVPSIILNEKETIEFTDPEHRTEQPQAFLVNFPEFCDLASEKSDIIVGDGLPRLKVVSKEKGLIKTEVVESGQVGPRKGINLTFAGGSVPVLTEKDYADIELACKLDAEFIALSFVRSAQDIIELKEKIKEFGGNCRVIAKIEKVEAFEDLDNIIEVSEGIMVARGDYGVEAGIEWVPAMQKETIHRATQAGKLVITATQMLESMILSSKPTRAEAVDVHNAVLDGTSAVMLSAETSVGKYPVESIIEMGRIAEVAELSNEIYCASHGLTAENPDAAIMYAAVALARDVDARIIAIPTTSGGTVRACVKYRPKRPVVALCHEKRVQRALALEWGVIPMYMPLSNDPTAIIERTLELSSQLKGIKEKDQIVITAGPSEGKAGTTNLIVLREAKNTPAQ